MQALFLAGGLGTRLRPLTEHLPKHPYGVVEQTDEGQIARFTEKPKKQEAPTNRMNAGIYIMERKALDDIPAGRVVSIEKVTFPLLIGNGSRIGSQVRLSQSILWDRCKIRSGAQINECIFGSGMQAGPHILHKAVCNRSLEVHR